MDRFTISLDEELAEAFDAHIKQRGYATRSEAVRDILRALLQRRDQATDNDGYCVASLSYVYNHHERQLAERLASLQHAHHDLLLYHAGADDSEVCIVVADGGDIGRRSQGGGWGLIVGCAHFRLVVRDAGHESQASCRENRHLQQ